MSKVELAKVTTPLNSHEFQAQINNNFEKVSEALDKQLQRDYQEGVDNEMSQELNMGGHRIVNIGKAVQPTDAMRKQEFDDMTANIEQWAQEAKDSAASAAEDEALSKEHRIVAVSAAQSAQEHERQTQKLFDTLMSDDSIPVVAENIEDVKDVANKMGDIEDTLENMEFIKGAVYASKTISFGNIGDIRATYANVPPKGCRFTNGDIITREEYPEVFDKMDAGEIAYHTVAVHQQHVREYGITGSFGYDPNKDDNVAYLPLLTEAFVEATNNTPHRVNDAGLPNITGEAGNYGNGTGANYYSSGAMYVRNYTGVVGESEDTQGVSSIYGIDASRSSAVYGKSDTVQPKSVMLRHYVILSNQHQMILNMKEQVSSASALPKTGNKNGDVRVAKDSGIAYVWVLKNDDTSKWESIGSVGTSGSGVVEWSDIQGDIAHSATLQQALDTKPTNTATGDYSLTMFGSPTNAPNAINIGYQSSATASSISLGKYAASISGGIAIGTEASSLGTQVTTAYPIPTQNIAIGPYAKTHQQETGRNSSGNIAIGFSAQTKGDMSTAIGYRAYVEADNAIQLGQGINTTEGSLQFRDYQLLDASGKIPAERLPAISGGSNDSFKALTEAQKATLLKDGTYNGSDVEDGEIFTEDSGKFVEFDKVLREAGTWETYSSDMTVSRLSGDTDAVEGNGVLVIARSSKIAVSSDGLNWETYSWSGSVNNNNIIFDGTQFVIYGNAKVFKSTDGKNWSTETVSNGPSYTKARYFSYDDGRYVIILSDGAIWTSEEAVTWSQIGTLPSSLFRSSQTAYISRREDGLYLAIGAGNQYSARVSKSTDLIEWSEPVESGITVSSATGDINGVCSIGNTFVISLSNGTPTGRMYWSEDGITWTASSPAMLSYAGSVRKRGNKLFVVGQYVYATYVSEDGKTFTKLKEDLPSKNLTSIARGFDKTFVFYASDYNSPTDVKVAVQTEKPYFEYAVSDLSYTKEEVDAAIADSSVELTDKAYAGEGICLLTEPVTHYEAVGTGPTVSEDYTATGFSGSNYLSKTLDSVEVAKGVVLKAAFSVSSSTASQILQLRDSSSAIIGRIAFTASGTVTGAIGSATITSTSTFTTGQKLYVRVAYDTTTLSLHTSTDGKAWNLEKSQSLSPSASSVAGKIATLVAVGTGATVATIYLPECSIAYQGKEIWRAAEGVGKTGIAVDKHLKLLVAEVGPSEATVGHIGQIYVNKAGNVAYMCVGTDSGNYIWKQITA